MSEMIDRVAQVINRAGLCDWKLESCRAGKCQCKALASAAIEALCDFDTEKYTFNEAEAIRRFLEEALK